MKNTFLLRWMLTFLIPCAVYLVAPQGVSPKLPLYMAMTSMAVSAWVLSVFPPIGVAALLTFGYLLGGVAAPDVVFKPWTTVLPWLSFAAIIIGHAMEKTGLAKRVALNCVRMTGGSFGGLAWGFALGGLILATFLSSILARMVILCAIAMGVIDALGIKERSRMSSAIIFMAFIGAAGPQFLFLHSSESNIWAFDVLFKGTDIKVNFWTYALQSSLFSVIYTAVSMLLIYMVKGKERLASGDVRAFLQASHAEMGVMTNSERKLAVICAILVGGFMFQPWTGIDPVYLFCVLALLCYAPGISILESGSLGNLNIMFLVFVTGSMSIGFVGGAVGANTWAVQSIVPLLSGWSDTMSVFISYCAGLIINFLLTPLAALGAFTPAIGELGKVMNINPLPVFYAFNYGLDQYLFPYETVYLLYIFVTGKVTLNHIMPALFVRMILGGLLIVGVAVPYWKLIGLL